MSACSPQPESCSLHFNAIETQLGFLQGKVLTVIDAAFSDATQRKAVKDLVKGHFRHQTRYINSLCFGGGAGVVVDSGRSPEDSAA